MVEILQAPKCQHCGHQVENDCPIGASCPKCNRRFLPDPPAAAVPGPRDEDFAILQKECDRLFGELLAERGITEALRARVAELEKGGARDDS